MSICTFLPGQDEVALIERCRREELGAYEEFCKRFSKIIYRVALRILKDENTAEDAVQETLLNAFRAMGGFRGEAKITTWLNRIVTNVCLEILRRKTKRKEDSFEEIKDFLADSLACNDSPFDCTYRRELRARLESSLRRVSAKQGEVVRMHDAEGLTIKEIARALNISEGTVKSRLFYGRQECRRYLNRSEKIH
ncbi:MAG: RNA polymerase sigma factor [Acidobacteria bacterium]|nr:RNA polymerase sigma factor [Acidobacteriota bacterium]